MLRIFIKLFLLIFFGFSNSVFGQSEIITGTIIDKNGTPIPGVNIVEDTVTAVVELFPLFSRMKMLRHWGGIVDICPDASPIVSKTHINGLL